jgi:ferritin-like metal-binding protein YciE
MPDTLDEQLTKHLTDAHSIEEQALLQMKVAPRLAADPEIARAFREHLAETQDHERRVRELLEARGAEPSRTKDLVAQAGAVGMVLFARSQPDTPGKLTSHAYSYEHMELAAYELLAMVAERAGDSDAAAVARSIGEQEGAMARRLEQNFDRAVDASLRNVGPDDLDEQLNKYLADAHAIEAQAIQLLQLGPKIAGESGLAQVLAVHLEVTRAQQDSVRDRLRARGGRPSRFKDFALRGGGVNIGGFFGAQPDTPAKLAGFAFAFEHLEIAAYEQLRRVAESAGDTETEALAERIVREERATAQSVRDQFEPAVDASLRQQKLRPGPGPNRTYPLVACRGTNERRRLLVPLVGCLLALAAALLARVAYVLRPSMLDEARLFLRCHLGPLDLAIDSLFHARQLVSVHTNPLPAARRTKRTEADG